MIDPEIAAFNRRLTAAWREHPALDTLSPAQARAVAEQVRAPLREGGPVMAQTTEHRVETPTGAMRVRVHVPAEGKPLPALIYLHGGGFVLFSIDTHDRLMREYAAAGRFAVIGIDYPLSPEARYPAALDAIVNLVAWLSEHGAQWGVDPTRLAIGGDSAGANLSVATCLRLRALGRGLIRAMLLNYGAFAATVSDEAEAKLGGPDAVLNRAEMSYFFENYLGIGAALDDPFACPILADLDGLPPAMLAIADQDVLAEQSVTMAERFATAGVACRVRTYPGATHSFLEAMESAELARRAIAEGAEWVASQLNA